MPKYTEACRPGIYTHALQVSDEAWVDALFDRARRARRRYLARNADAREHESFVKGVWDRVAETRDVGPLTPAWFAYDQEHVTLTNTVDALNQVSTEEGVLSAGALAAQCFNCGRGDASSKYVVFLSAQRKSELYIRLCAACMKRNLEVTHDDVWE